MLPALLVAALGGPRPPAPNEAPRATTGAPPAPIGSAKAAPALGGSRPQTPADYHRSHEAAHAAPRRRPNRAKGKRPR
jgi:hypothetical protein